MNSIKKFTVAALAATALATPAAFAQTAFQASATTDLNMRSGPGPEYQVVGLIDAGATANVNGCVEGGNWCQVTYNGTTGWSYSDYLATNVTGETMAVAALPQDQVTPIPRPDNKAEQVAKGAVVGGAGGAAAGAVGGAIAGTLVGGPVGAAAGAAIGAGAGAAAGGTTAAITPPNTVDTYVSQHTADPVYLNGEVVVGAQVPANVSLQPVPEYNYQYANINGQTVLVDANTRQIVHVYR